MYLLRATAALIIALAIMTVPSYAADKGGSSKRIAAAPVVEEPTSLNPNWSTCYAGVGLGYGIQSSDVSAEDVSLATKDMQYGIRLGCDQKLAGTNIVLGVLGDYDFQSAESAVAELDRSWFLGVRAGLLFAPSTMGYVLAGYTSLDGTFAAPDMDDKGLTLGAGLETFVTKTISLTAEYRWVDLGESTLEGYNADNSMHVARVGLNLRFNGLGN